MKKLLNTALTLSLLLLVLCTMWSCAFGGNTTTTGEGGIWASATYTEDTELGEGAKTVYVKVQVEEHSVTFTIHTDAEMLGDALTAHSLISGDEGAFGIYIKYVNGIRADYELDGAYWGFFSGGEMMMSGVDTTPISDGEHYELVYSK